MNFRISFAICKVVTSAESSPIKETGKRKKVQSSASRKLFEEDSTDRECHGTSLKLTPEVWAGIPVQEVKSLPYDIDGVQIFRLNYDRADKMATTLDGRQWSGYITSRRSGFVGKRFIKSCKGSHRCGNELCGYFRQFKKMNRVHFEKKGSVVKCSTCGATAEFVPCPCKKIWEYPNGDAKVTVYHYGTHTCVPIKRALQPQLK
ncbi:unnamed protein product [Porites lobata]|uniref:Uncharacterized protein n=1 Tax=Porites lobata TaxID=104759 RepID=A0ABN8NH69_9CNID|nr:unnamed protein product [Porites lobata]